MLNMQVIIAQIQKNNIDSAILNDLITDHQIPHDKMISNYQRYKASNTPDGVPIFSRKMPDVNKVNNKLNEAFDAEIIDVKLGYMIGNPIIYELDKTLYTENDVMDQDKYDLDIKVVRDFNKANNAEDLDGETLKLASICGYGSRLLYIDKAGQTRMMNVKPWECIFITDGSINEAQYALRYYEIIDDGKKKIYVEWYDDKNISFYITADEIGKSSKKTPMMFIPYEKNGETKIPHMFNGIPLIQFMNNEELQGDCDKVYADIDAYDRSMSDVNSEIETFRLAYMAIYGMNPTEEERLAAKQTGIFGLPDKECKIEFITKEINDAAVEHHLDRLEKNIYRFGKSVNFDDISFGGTVTGVAMKFKMFEMETKCIMSERKFTTALRTQYKILATVWSAKGSDIDYMNLNFVWTRNFPLNLVDEADSTVKLKGLVSEKTRLGLLSFIDNPEKEMAAMEKDNLGMVDLNAPQFDEDGNVIEGGQENGNV